jgi:hypothetical protein
MGAHCAAVVLVDQRLSLPSPDRLLLHARLVLVGACVWVSAGVCRVRVAVALGFGVLVVGVGTSV